MTRLRPPISTLRAEFAGVLGEGCRCRGAKLACQSARDADAFPLDLCPGLAPAVQRGRVVDEIHANFCQNGFGIGFDDLKRFLVQNVQIGNVAFNIFRGFQTDRRARRTPGRAAAPHCARRRPPAPLLMSIAGSAMSHTPLRPS